jgi:acyl-CoA synthetase (AMP-forming)/AMP-acid ligase II
MSELNSVILMGMVEPAHDRINMLSEDNSDMRNFWEADANVTARTFPRPRRLACGDHRACGQGAPAMTATVDLSAFPRRIHHMIDHWRQQRAEALAVTDHDGRRLSYANFGAAVDDAETMLRDAGVRGGDRVLIVNENCTATAAFLFACSRLDAWAVLLNARLAAPEVDRIRDHCGPRAMVFTHACSPDAAAHGVRLGAAETTSPQFGPVLIAGHRDVTPEPVDDTPADQVAAMIYTSGTTGQPKGVMLTHQNVLYIAIVSGRNRALQAADRVYAVLPISHVFGLAATVLGTFHAGGEVVMVPRFNAGHLADALADGVTVFQGVPAMYAKLLEHLERHGRALKAPRLRYMSSGGAPLDIDWKRRIEARFGLTLNNGYGLTEASPTIAQTLIHSPRDDDSIGPPLEGLETRIVGPEGQDMPQGTVGDLWVRGPTIMKGYYRAPQATRAAVTEDGWLKTGDLCRQDESGALFLVGRSKELIIRSGFNVYPPEVETALNAHPDVTLSAVVGRRVPGNEEVIAFVETSPGSTVDEDALSAFVAEKLAAYKRPQRIFIVDALPASATGKIQKHLLARLAETPTTDPQESRP